MGVKSLDSTFIYNHLNKDDILTKCIVSIINSGTVLNKSDLEEAFMIINKNFKFPLKNRVMEAFDNGDIILKIPTTNNKLPLCLPFILAKNNNKVVSIISADLYGVYNSENKHFKIDAKKLYCLMESAYLAKIYYLYGAQLKNRSATIINGSAIYANMFTKVLNKKYSLNINKTKLHNVLMLSSKFFMINLLGMNDSDMVFNYAIKNCPNGNLMLLKDANDMTTEADFKSLKTFIDLLVKPELGLNLKDLTIRNYLETFINMYEGSALLSLESFPYFLYNVISVVNGAYLNNQYALEDIVDSHGAKLYVDVCNLDR